MEGLTPVIDWTFDINSLIGVGSALFVLWQISRTQARRDEKIDLILFGVQDRPGLVGDVELLKRDRDIALSHLSTLGLERRIAGRRHDEE